MSVFAALDVSQEQTAVCVVDGLGSMVAAGKVAEATLEGCRGGG